MQNIGPQPLISMLRFHLGAGGRLVQRVFVPVFCTILVMVVFTGPVAYARFYAALIGGRYLSSALPTTLLILGAVALANRRLAKGLTGWLRHLPVKGRTLKWSIILGLLITISPVLLIMALSSATAAGIIPIPTVSYLIGLPMTALAAAHFCLPTKQRYLPRLLLILASLGYSSMDWRVMAAALVCHVGGAMAAGPLITLKKGSRYSSERWLHVVLTWRAMGMRLLTPYLLALLILPILFLFLANNPTDALQASRAIRLSSALMLIVFCATTTHIMVARRPPWPWSRSLPWSSSQRVKRDSYFLLLHLLPLISIITMVEWRMIFWIICSLPALIFLSLAAGLRARNYRFGIFGQIMGQTLLPLLILGLSPWVSLGYLALSPLLWKWAVVEEMSLAVSQWLAVSYLADGDSESWRKD
jgi:hypothetical protein